MGTTAISHTMQELLQRQEAFFRRIPGISALRMPRLKAFPNWKPNTRTLPLP